MKKNISLVLAGVAALAGLVGCTTPAPLVRTATIGLVGGDKHQYLSYSTVTVEDGIATAIKVSEVFLPAGKLWSDLTLGGTGKVLTGNVAYNNPWYKGFADAEAAIEAATDKAAAVKTGENYNYRIQIGDRTFGLDVVEVNYKMARFTDILRFVDEASGVVLTDEYVADNIEWYLAAIEADQLHALKGNEAKGSKNIDTALDGFQDGAPDKSDEASIYQGTNEGRSHLSGKSYSKYMEKVAAYMLENNCKVTYAHDGSVNYNGDRVPGITFTDVEGYVYDNGDTTPPPAATGRTLQYAASYVEVIILAWQAAGGYNA